jgi:hypothetical protein
MFFVKINSILLHEEVKTVKVAFFSGVEILQVLGAEVSTGGSTGQVI